MLKNKLSVYIRSKQQRLTATISSFEQSTMADATETGGITGGPSHLNPITTTTTSNTVPSHQQQQQSRKFTFLDDLDETSTKAVDKEYFTDLDKTNVIIAKDNEFLAAAEAAAEDTEEVGVESSEQRDMIYDNKDKHEVVDVVGVGVEKEEAELKKNVTCDDVNFDDLENSQMHFDKRMLKLIEGKLQAKRNTASATSFSNILVFLVMLKIFISNIMYKKMCRLIQILLD